VRRTLAASVIVAAAAGSANAAVPDDQPIAEIVITGTHIRQTDQGALPVEVLNHEQIQETGATNVEQFLQTVSVAVQGNNNTTAASGSGATTGGVSSVSLRGLGSQRTLVLINGRRVAGGGTITDSTSVDINGIPLQAVERVEVLKDGASAIYGSDAIAGVINFIMRKDFQGAEVSAYGGGTSGGGAGTKRIDALLGLGDPIRDRFNVMLGASWQKDNPLFGAQRGFASSAINVAANNDTTSGNTFPANIAVPGFGTHNPLAGNCSPSVSDPLIDPTGRCRYDPSGVVSLLPAAERYSAFLSGSYKINSNAELYAEASYTRHKQRFVIQPTPLSDQFNIPNTDPIASLEPYKAGDFSFATIVLQPTSPFYPTAFVKGITGGSTPNLLVRYRAVTSGRRDLTDTSKQPRFVVGIKGDVAGWEYDGNFLYSETKLSEVDNNGYAQYSKILPLLNSGQVNFFGPNSDAILSQIASDNFYGEAYSTKTSITGVSANATRSLVDLPAGPLAVAVGAEFRKEKFSTNPSAALQIGDVSGYGGNFLPVDKARNVSAVYGEINVPIIDHLTADGAVRFDDYQNVGNKTTPKIGLRWQPMKELLFRGSYGKGFRAPSLTELFSPQTTGVSGQGLTDPARCATTNSSNDCQTQFNVLLGGQPHLKPEQSDNYTLGITIEPTSDVSLALDAFKIKLTNPIIFGVDPQAILNDPGQFGSFVARGAPTPDCPGCPGPVQQINQINLNLGQSRIEGLDVDFRHAFSFGDAGRLTLQLMGTYFQKYEVQLPNGAFTRVVGLVSPITNGSGGIIPRWHHFLSLVYKLQSWDFVASQNYQSGYHDLPPSLDDPTVTPYPQHPRDVSNYTTYDFQVAYSGVDHLRLAVGVKNAFNTDPPYTNAGGQSFFQAGYDPGYGDPRGRFVYGNVTYSIDGRK
jgi:iron complex outermembrane receptor protein